MKECAVYDFDTAVSRAGTFAEKYEARERFFGKPDVEPFWVADMDLPTPAFIPDALRARLEHPMFGYTEQYRDVFDAIGWWMENEHGAAVEHNWISLSPSVVTSISVAVQSLTKPGENVVVLSPVYGPFFSCAQINGRTVSDCPLTVENGRMNMDFDAVETAVQKPETKLLIHCNPHNPGGRVWEPAELEKLARLCAENGVVIFSDEIHCDIVYPPNRHLSMLNVEIARGNCIVAHSIGKTFNCGGLQASFTLIPEAGLRTRFRAGLDRSHCGDINLLGKTALTAALSPEGAEYKRQLNAYLHENIRQVCDKLGGLDSVEIIKPEATFLVWCDFRKRGHWQDVFKRLVHEANVALSGGTFFGPAGEGWFRINCAHPRAQLLAAVERILRVFH